MAHRAHVINVMIASPNDVREMRQIAREVLTEWNELHETVILRAVGWDSHASPELGTPAQELINKRLLAECDLLIGIFWTRIGTPVLGASSGSVSEIQQHVAAGKPAMIYFCDEEIRPSRICMRQLGLLKKFRRVCMGSGLVEMVDDRNDFAARLRHQLQITLGQNPYLQRLLGERL